MIQIAICDDESNIIDLISTELRTILKPLTEYRYFKTTNPQEIIELVKRENIDLLLIDIEMPQISGFEVAKQAKFQNENVVVIFITNFDMYVYESLKYRPFRFVRKTHLEELEEALLSALTIINSNMQIYNIRISAYQNINMKLEDIVYFESIHNDVKITAIERNYTYRSTLKSIEKDLKDKGFVRIHSGFLINLKYVYLIRNDAVEIHYKNNKINLPLSRARRDNLVTQYTKIIR